jgi:uncharacterized protein YbjT (DUF2867 family)
MILVAGASGCIGSALLASWRAEPPEARPAVRAFVRREFDAVRLRDQGFQTVTGDAVTGRGLDEAMRGVHTLVYLVHTIDRPGDVVANDLEAAQNALIAARAAGVHRVILVGHIAANEEATSEFLVARWAVELAVRQSGLGWTVLRAPLVVGRGSTLFELMRRVVDRSLIVPLFAWRRTEVEPVALGDVVAALRIAIEDDSMTERTFDICGAEMITFREVVRGYARGTGKRRIYLPLPGRGERVGGQLAWSLARLPRRETRLLLETLRERQVCTDPSRRFPLGRRPLDYPATVEALLESGRGRDQTAAL